MNTTQNLSKSVMLRFISGFAFLWLLIAYGVQASAKEKDVTRIKITINGRVSTAKLFDNPTARDFITLLPLKLLLKDYASTEKIANPPRKLSTNGVAAGAEPTAGDIAYYVPWGNLALFYKDFDYSAGLVIIGKFDDGAKPLHFEGSAETIFEILH